MFRYLLWALCGKRSYLHVAVVMHMEREKRFFVFASSLDEFLIPSMIYFIRVYVRWMREKGDD